MLMDFKYTKVCAKYTLNTVTIKSNISPNIYSNSKDMIYRKVISSLMLKDHIGKSFWYHR